MKKPKILSSILVALFVSSMFTIGLGSISIDDAILNTNRESVGAATPTGLGHHIPSMPSILIYTEFADLIPDPGDNEFSNTMESIQSTYGYGFYYENLTDYGQLGSKIDNFDILLIVEQESAEYDNMTMVGTAWSGVLSGWISNGGIVILMDYGWPAGGRTGVTSHIYNSSGLMDIYGYASIPGSTVYLTNSSDALARGVASSFTALSGALSFETSDGTTVVDDTTDSVVVHKIMDEGHVVLLGFDMFNRDANYDALLANAIRLHRHVVFDESHSQYNSILADFSDFADDLVAEGFAVSRMTDFNEEYISGCEVLVLTTGTTNYTIQEAAAIESFVQSGRGLFVATDYYTFGEELDPVTERFGFIRNKTSYLTDSDDTIYGDSYNVYDGDNIANHSITISVDRLELDRAGAFESIPSGAVPLVTSDIDGTSTWVGDGSPADGVVLAAAVTTGGHGRVSMIMDMNFMDDATNPDGDAYTTYNDGANSLYLVNNIRWLSAAGIEEKHVLFDESHNPYSYVNSNYDIFAYFLTENGYTVKWMSTFHSELFHQTDVLVITDGSADYDPSNITEIVNYVANGGSLFIICDNGQYCEQVAPIGSEFGLEVNTTGYLTDTDAIVGSSYLVYNTTNFANHPIMTSVTRIEVNRGTGFESIGSAAALIQTDDDGTATWNDGSPADAVPVFAADTYAKGRIVMITDVNFVTTNDGDSDGYPLIYDSDNPTFLANSFYWMTMNRAPSVTVTFPNGGEVLNGTQVITWNAADLDDDSLTFDVYYSDNNGTDWTALATGLAAHELSWNTTQHSDAYGYMIRVVASDGLLTAQDASDGPFELDNFAGTTTTGIPVDPMLLLIIAAVAGVVVIIIIIVVKRKK